ncbi:carotenoid oxygenase family protein [Streptomyces sp. NPDC017095]|uniref:carotenoid oxygenase family protein n=1 Tax=Streptomyces sp. NPDC017095 TaxID=3364977 RepID=UPI0037947E59
MPQTPQPLPPFPDTPQPLPDFPGYTTLDKEVRIDRLPVEGALPEWLSGTLIRNGPAKFEVGDYRLTHWFNGIGMLHAYSFGEGQVSYANKYLRTTAYDLAVNKGQLYGKQFGIDPCQELFGRHFAAYSPNISDNTNVNLTRLANRFFAFNEQPLYTEFDPRTLDTIGELTFEDQIAGELSTPHPHYDFERRALLNYTTAMREKTVYNVYYTPEDTQRQTRLATIETGEDPRYMHSFAATENYVVLVEIPVVIDRERFLEPGNPFLECFSWQPERGTRFLVVDKREGRVTRTFEGPAFFAFHHINASETGSDLLIDIAVTETPYESVLGLAPSPDQFDLQAYGYAARRFTLPLGGTSKTARVVDLTDAGVEMPRINYRAHNGKAYRYAYGLGHSPRSLRAMNRLLKLDVVAGTHKAWYEKGSFPSEAVFVGRPGATAEDDGVVLSGVLDAKTGTSFLLVLDAASFEELGRARVPHHIPNDFHGVFFSDLPRLSG